MNKVVVMWVVIAAVLTTSAVVMHDEATLDVDAEVVGVGCTGGYENASNMKENEVLITQVKLEITSYENSTISPVFWADDKNGNVYFKWPVQNGTGDFSPGETKTVTVEPHNKSVQKTTLDPEESPRLRIQNTDGFVDVVLPPDACSSSLTYRNSIRYKNYDTANTPVTLGS